MYKRRSPLIVLLLAICGLVGVLPLRAQSIQNRGEQEAVFNEIYGRAMRLDRGEKGSSEVLHHIWMASLVDNQQPVLLWDRAYYQAYLGNSKATLDDLELAYANSNYDRHIGNALMQMAAMYSEWDLAEKVSTRLLADRPDDAAQIGYLINIYEQSGQKEKALNTLRKLKGSSRTTAIIYRESQLLTELGRVEEAEQLLLEHLKVHPNEPSSIFMLVALYGNQDRYDEAANLVKSLVDSHPEDPYVRRFSVAFYAMAGLNQEIAEYILKESKRKGTEPAILMQMMDVAQEESKDPVGLFTALLPVQKQLYEQFPTFHAFGSKQAATHLILQDTLAAEGILTKMIDMGSSEKMPYHYFFEKYAAKEDVALIKKLLKVALVKIPDDGTARLHAIYLAAQEEDSIAFNTQLEEALKMVPKSDRFYPQIALAKAEEVLKDGDWNLAKQYYEESIATNPSVVALNNYAYALSNHGSPEDLKRAEEMARLAVQHSGDEPSHLDTYAWVLYKRESYSMAKLYMEKAIAAQEEPDPLYYEHLAVILEAMKDYKGAINAWEKVIEFNGDKDKATKKVAELRKLVEQLGDE